MKPRLPGRIVLALGLTAFLTTGARGADLGIGDPAPPLAISKWVKGEPVEKFEKDGIYVVEFWATWCGPCRVSIPHLTELQKEYQDKGVRFIGVSIWESDPDEVEPFVEEMGDKMDYAVAKDDLSTDPKGQMAKTWMDAAGQQGIPSAFIVKAGQIAWIGHPMSMDKPLEKIVSGDFDIKRAAEEHRKSNVAREKLQAITPKLIAAMQANKPEEALEVVTQAIQETPELEEQLGLARFGLLIQAGRSAEAVEYADKLVEILSDEPQGLNNLAWQLIDPDRGQEPSEPEIKLALKAAEKANEASDGKDAPILDTLALAVFLSGDKDRAIELQEHAVELGEKAGLPDQMIGEMKQRLERFRKDGSK